MYGKTTHAASRHPRRSRASRSSDAEARRSRWPLGGSHARYGGIGGFAWYGGTPNQPYGDPLAPDDLGSGGGAGTTYSEGGNGGGKVKMTAASIAVNGDVVADGGTAISYGGGGSGGAVALALSGGTFSGSGTIRAGGGTGWVDATGGGGRVLVAGTGTVMFGGTMTSPGYTAGSVVVTAAP